MLRNVSLFSDLTDQELAVIEQRMVVRTYPKGAIIINEGEDAISLYVRITGGVKVSMNNEEGKEIILNSLGPGEYFGEMALIDDQPRSASIVTIENSKFLIINKPAFHHILEQRPNIAIGLLKNLSKRIRSLSDNVKSLALTSSATAAVKTLLNMAKEKDGRLIIEQKLTQQDIASRIGSSREMVARILKDLSNGGYISIESKRIIINEKLPKAY